MDSLITAAARALAAGDPLGALKWVSLRDDAPALALRGIAMAQLGDLVRARALLRSAARAFSPREAVARARCLVAEAEIALASRDLSWPVKSLDAARATLEAHGDPLNAAYAREVEARRASKALVVDACRYVVRAEGKAVSLASRPVLFELARALGEAWPGDVPRDVLLARAFGAKLVDESHRARLRVEIGRLRRMLRTLATVSATKSGFLLVPCHAREVVVLARPFEGEHGAVLAFLTDGESWSSSALALALGTSQRTVQRALDSLAAAGRVQAVGRAPSRRWMTPPVPGFTTTLLLPAPLPSD